MIEQMAVLYEVQQADLEIARLKQALVSLDTGELLRAEIAAAEAELAKVRKRLSGLEAERLDQTLELETLSEKKTRFEAQLYGGKVSNPRQLGDLQEEVNMLKREGDRVETRVIELMLELEQQGADLAGQEAELAGQRARLQELLQQFEVTSRRLQAEIAQWEERRRGAATQVNAHLLKRYDQIRVSKGNLGLARVTDQTCPGCRVAIPSERLRAIKAGRVGETCDNCGRLLMWGGAAEPPRDEEDEQ